MSRVEAMIKEYTRLPGTEFHGDSIPGVGPVLRVLHDGKNIFVDRSDGSRVVTWTFRQEMSDPLGYWVEA